MNDSKAMTRLLRAVANLLDALTDDEARELVEGTAKLRVERHSGARKSKQYAEPARTPDLEQIAAALRSLGSREEGARYLKEQNLSKRDLEALARAVTIPVTKRDTTDHLREKIIENVIGSRLASEAVRGRTPSQTES